MNIYFVRRIPNIPASIVSLLDSKYGLTFIDNSQLWAQSDRTFLNVVASSFRPLSSLSDDLAQKEMIEDLKRFIPFADTDIDYVDYQSHLDEPLFSGIVGAWQHRPRPKSELKGLYFCGDYCQSHVDVISVESAVTTGLNAAAALIDDRGLENHMVV